MYVYPNYKNNIINISATLDEYLGNSNNVNKLEKLKKYLNNDYKNVVFMILDGFGYYLLKKHLPNDNILRQNNIGKVTSVFPSTTTNATTTLMSCTYPGEHCWLGWSLYFKELDKCLDIYLNKVSYKEEYVDSKYVISQIPHGAYYENVNNNINTYTVFPSFVGVGLGKNNFYYENIDEMFSNLNKVCKSNDKKLVYSYCGEPDKTMHRYGASSFEANVIIKSLANKVEELAKNPDTLIIISADHGHIDVESYIEIYQDKEFLSTLARPLSLEVRAASVVVKDGKEKEFFEIFKKKYNKDLRIVKVDTMIKKGVFGTKVSDKAKEFLGDYLLVHKNNKKCIALGEGINHFKGHHTGLSKEEMYVPLIVIENKQKTIV